MATILSTLGEHLCCSICTELFTDPVTLSCQHTFCQQCLRQSLTAGHQHCPECRDPVKKINFQINRLIRNMAEQLRLEQLRLEKGRGQRGTTGRKDTCPEHGEVLRLFCEIDHQLICPACIEGKHHRGHLVQPVREAQENLQAELSSALGLLKEDIDQAQQKIENQKLIITKRAEKSDQLKDKARGKFEELIHGLRDKEEKMMKEIEEKSGLVNMKINLTEMERYETEARERLATLQSGLDITDPAEFLNWWTEKGKTACHTGPLCLGINDEVCFAWKVYELFAPKET